MNREEIKKKIMCLIEDKGSHELDMNANDCFTMDGVNIFYIGDEITDFIIKHEQDTLKEFAVYVMSVYFQRKFFRENYTVDEILLMLNNDIENFIKEKQK